MRSPLFLMGLIALAGASPFEVLNGVPEGWTSLGAPAPEMRLHLRIALTQPEPEKLEKTLYDVSTPGSVNYGNHLSREELKRMMKPRSESTDAVLTWLRQSGVAETDIQNDGEWINFVAPVSVAESMLETEFLKYQSDANSDIKKVRTLEYSIPSELEEHVYMIQPTTRFGQIRPQFSTVHRVQRLGKVPSSSKAPSAAAASCNSTVTPACLKDLYNVKGYTPDPELSYLGVNGFLKQYARYDDLKQFNAAYNPDASDTFDFQSVNGGQLPQNSPEDSVEANLDIQYTVAMSDPIPNTFYSTPGLGKLIPDLDQPTQEDNQNEPYLDFFTYLTNLDDDELPSVLSTSYGEDEQSVPAKYSKKVCDMIGQLGTRGVSVLFSSGDTGVGSACQTNDGKNTTRFLPIFPAACPYVTSVGGTYQVPEIAVHFSSGGFSDRWARPAYQDEAVTTYLGILGDQWKGLYNPEGRGFPDVAAQGLNFHVVDKGEDILVGGTSASAPTFSGIIARVSNALIADGSAPLGFLNPWIYSSGYKALNDVTAGGSDGCTGRDIYSGLPTPKVPFASWNATKGWDPVTGYGTPNFKKLLKSARAAAGSK